MKTKYYALGMVALVATCAIWFGPSAWRRHHQLVTLDVRNVPLAEVLRKIEGQTGQKIRAESGIDARVTLHVEAKPLAYVLDWLAEQAGARWSTLYAVYGSAQALTALETALRGDGKLEPVGWRKIAPNLPPMILPGADDSGDSPASGAIPQVRRIQQHPDRSLAVTATEDVIAIGPSGSKPRSGAPVASLREQGPITLRVIRKGGTGGADSVKQEILTPEELVMESGLSSRLGDPSADLATPATAETTAQKLNARWTTYFALRKSSLGMAFGGMPVPGPGLVVRRVAMPGTGPQQNGTNFNGPPESMGPPHIDFQAAAQRERNEPFARLTPEQRVQRARQHLEVNQN